MPSSYAGSFTPIVHTIIDYAPRHVLDIGPGWGKYGLACREYLPNLETLDAVEVRQGRYETQDVIYGSIFVGDIRDAPEQFFLPYDLVLFIDVIEHLPLEDGHELLARMQRAGPNVLVSTPTRFFEQHVETNPYETHISFWDATEIAPHTVIRDVSTVDAGIFLIKGRR